MENNSDGLSKGIIRFSFVSMFNILNKISEGDIVGLDEHQVLRLKICLKDIQRQIEKEGGMELLAEVAQELSSEYPEILNIDFTDLDIDEEE